MKPDPLQYGYEATYVGIILVIHLVTYRPGAFAGSIQNVCIRTKPGEITPVIRLVPSESIFSFHTNVLY